MDLTSTDPSRAICDTCQFVFSALYETLVTLADDNKTLVPRLATKWTGSDNNTVYTFDLDPKAVFADGSPVEAKDVKFSLMRLKNLKGNAAYLVNAVDSIDTPDAHTVVVHLSAPNSEFPNGVSASYTGIINSDVAMKNGATDGPDAATTDTAEKWFQSNSPGSGPYTLNSFTENSEVTLVRNDKFWGKAPAVKRIVVKQTETAASQAQMLQSGAADIAMQIDPVTAKSLKGNPDITVKSIPSFNFFWLGMNQQVSEKTDVPLSADIRKAIQLGIDYKGLLKNLVSDKGKLQAAPIPNGFPGSKGLPLPAQDQAKAKQLLAKAGVPSGFALTLSYPTINAYGVDLGQIAQLLQSQLKEIGINITLNPATFSVNIDDMTAFKLPMELLYWAPDYYGTAQYFNYFGQIPSSTWSQTSASGPPIIDQAETDFYNQALASSDESTRDALFGKAGQKMIDSAVTIPLFSPDLILAYRNVVKGTGYSACCNIKLWQLSGV